MAYGTVNADVISTSTPGGVLGAGNASIMKNRIINGAIVIDQRNAGASVTPTTTAYLVDRFYIQPSQASKLSFQQNAGSVTPPAGFTNYLGATSLSAYSISSSDYFNLGQNIEGYNVADLGWGTANAKTVTISFWVRSSLTGTFGVSLRNNDADRNYQASYTVSSANTWEQKSLTVAGDTTGTWTTNNTTGIRLGFGLGIGSTYSTTAGAWSAGNLFGLTGATSVVGTSGATFYITGVQLEVGSSATGFEYRSYGTELALCQRYYYKWTPTSSASYLITGNCIQTTATYGWAKMPVTMRSAPTLSTSGTASDYGGYAGSASFVNSSVPAMDTSNADTPLLSFSSSGFTVGLAAIAGSKTVNGFLGFSSEL